MNTIKNLAQKLKELPVPLFPTKKYIGGSQSDEDEDVVEENFWPNIRKHILADDPEAEPIKAICSVCWDELHVTCISSSNDKLEVGLVAPCGHIMCPACWPREIFDSLHTIYEGCRKCPVCETLLECFICRKACNKVEIPTHGGEAAIESFPKTAPECGREYRPYCKDCAKPCHQKGDGFWFENTEEQESMNRSSARSESI
ncbi:uncharacterized protein FFB20_03493 [Fusarium fujikuroi]|nr:uncharacterized protein Y057_11194 [Fusarium fujikuroi]KLP18884.1 uncharacterized protein LW94_6812 [Fusarium fujikuroi]SCN69485.1 uncharacterized protein FFB20_03493 [Fusarium fujikuroi]SCO12045.1 uncharacterized protein FFE2_12498 [Fusarium fujikuroi]SCO22862.1 uncharacterized protein FFC1_14545 [Fusarium fujikuroi]